MAAPALRDMQSTDPLMLSVPLDASMACVLERTRDEADEPVINFNPSCLNVGGELSVTYTAKDRVRANPKAGKPKRKRGRPRKQPQPLEDAEAKEGAEEEEEEGDEAVRIEPNTLVIPSCGRLIAEGASPQTWSAWARRLLLWRTCLQVDQVSASWHAIAEVAAAIDYPVDWTSETRIRELRRQFEKQQVISVLFGASVAGMESLEAEVDAIRARALKHDAYAELVKRHGYDMHKITSREMWSILLFDIEKRRSFEVANYFHANGYEVVGFVYDAVLLRRKEPSVGAIDWSDIPTVVSEQIDAGVLSRCPVRVREEPLVPTPADIRRLLELPRNVTSPLEAAIEFYAHNTAYVRHFPGGVALYDADNNVWICNNEDGALLGVVLPRLAAAIGHRLRPINGRGLNFCSEARLVRGMYESLRTVAPLRVTWLEDALRNTRGLLAYRNGYFDFNAHQFIEGKCPDMNFVVGVRDTYECASDNDLKRVRAFFAAPYSDDNVFHFYMIAMARALAGDVSAKQGYVLLGPSGTGKSVATSAIVGAFPGVATPFDPSNLCNVGGNRDRARDFSWVAPMMFTRVCIGNEIDMLAAGSQSRAINHIMWKTLVSGGEDSVHIRFLYKEIQKMSVGFTVFVQANDMPRFTAVDDALVRRTHIIQQTRTSAPPGTPLSDDHFPEVPLAGAMVRERWFINGLRRFMEEMYALYQRVGHAPPTAVRESTIARVDPNDQIGDLLSAFDVWSEEQAAHYGAQSDSKELVADGWRMRFNEIQQTLQRAKLGISATTAVQRLCTHNPSVTRKRMASGNVCDGIRARNVFRQPAGLVHQPVQRVTGDIDVAN